MPASKVTSTTVRLIDHFSVSEIMLGEHLDPTHPAFDPDQPTFDPAALAAVLRKMSNLERALFASGLTKQQKKLLSQLSHCRVPIWKMVPEGY